MAWFFMTDTKFKLDPYFMHWLYLQFTISDDGQYNLVEFCSERRSMSSRVAQTFDNVS